MGAWFEKQTVGALPDGAARRFGAREALAAAGRRWSFRALAAAIDEVAQGLMALGIGRGDRVALWMTNRVEWILAMFAVAKVGGILVPLNTRYRTHDAAYALRQSQAAMLICCAQSGPVVYADMIRAMLPGLAAAADPHALRLDALPDLRRIVMLDATIAGALSWAGLLAAGAGGDPAALAARAAAVDPDDAFIIAYTSGTTGNPKGVVHGHACVRNVIDCASRIGVTETDVILNYLPMFHLYAFSACALFSVLTGARQVLFDAFDADAVLDAVESERATIIHGFDTHYRDLLAAQAARPRDLGSLRLGTFPAGMENSAPTARRAQTALCPTVSVYGMTELWCFPSVSFLDSTPEQRADASGYPMPGYAFRIVDPETGAERARGEPGEILVRGYMVTRGYWRDADATAAAIDAAGWFHTGDLGLVRADGHLRFLGRHKDMLKVGGENVSPAEVESLLMAHAAVAEVAVVGMPDDRLAEVPVAFVRWKPGAACGEPELIAFCRGKIASFKIPRRVFTVQALPATPTGKVQKHVLRAAARQRLPEATIGVSRPPAAR